MRKGFVVALLSVLASGCSPMRYSQYTGKSTVWQTSDGTMSETSYAIPVYRGWPERPYKVLGSVRFEDSRKYWDDGVIRMAASTGKRNGGNAIVIRQGAEFGVAKITGAVNPSLSVWRDQTTALVIRWLTAEEIKKLDEQKRQFLEQAHADALLYRRENPNVKANEAVEEMLIQYLIREGATEPYAKDMAQQFAEALERISKKAENDLSGTWVYKGTLTSSGIASSGDEDTLLGLATVKVDGESIAILSSAGRTEINFNGSHAKGRVQGQIGIGSFSSKCEGAALNNKISLSFQSVTPDGTLRGSLVFQR